MSNGCCTQFISHSVDTKLNVNLVYREGKNSKNDIKLLSKVMNSQIKTLYKKLRLP